MGRGVQALNCERCNRSLAEDYEPGSDPPLCDSCYRETHTEVIVGLILAVLIGAAGLLISFVK